MTFDVFAIARLLTDDEQRRVIAAFAENGLRAGAPQRTRAARRGRCAQLRERMGVRGRGYRLHVQEREP